MSVATAVDAHWLADLGGVFYSVKEKGYSAIQGKREIEYSKKAELEKQIEIDRAAQKAALEMESRHGADREKNSRVVPKSSNSAVKKGSAVVKPTIGRRR